MYRLRQRANQNFESHRSVSVYVPVYACVCIKEYDLLDRISTYDVAGLWKGFSYQNLEGSTLFSRGECRKI
jgi:hypothetical protein